jgi:hypothetical protein
MIKWLLKQTLKSTPKSKSGATGSTSFCNRVKITTFSSMGLKDKMVAQKKL